MGGVFGCVFVGEKVAPVFAFSDFFEEDETAAQGAGDVGDEDVFPDEASEKAEGKGEAELVVEDGSSVDAVEAVVVLEALEAAAAHGVLEEVWGLVPGDEGFVHLGEAELPTCPKQLVSGDDAARGFSFERLHVQAQGDELDIGGQEKTPFEGGIDVDGVADGEHAF